MTVLKVKFLSKEESIVARVPKDLSLLNYWEIDREDKKCFQNGEDEDNDVYRFTHLDFICPQALPHGQYLLHLKTGKRSSADRFKLSQESLDGELIPIALYWDTENPYLLIDTQYSSEQIYFAYEPLLRWDISTDVGTDGDCDYLLLEKLSMEHKVPFITDTSAIPFRIEKGHEEEFVENSFVQMPFELVAGKQLIEELSNLPLKSWRQMGPFDYRRFHIMDIPVLSTGVLGEIMEYLKGDEFLQWVQGFSGLAIKGLQQLNFRRLQPGDYQILHGDYEEPLGLDIVVTLIDNPAGNDCDELAIAQEGGNMIYLSEGEQVASVLLRHSTMALAYRVEGCTRFMSYIPLNAPLQNLASSPCSGRDENKAILYQIHLNYKIGYE